jgi:hypothetical protein
MDGRLSDGRIQTFAVLKPARHHVKH